MATYFIQQRIKEIGIRRVNVVDITADGYKPCLAESWDISADGKVYTFHIRKGVTFTDATAFYSAFF